MARLDRVIVKNQEIPWRMIEGEAVLIDRDEGELIRLDHVGTEIWHAMDGRRTIEAIIDHICRTFEVERKRAQKDVLRFLRQLSRREIVQQGRPMNPDGGRPS